MITGLRGASIWSEDVKNLLPFYRDVLGLKVGFERPGLKDPVGAREGTTRISSSRLGMPRRTGMR
jgi:hypothetical protein